jgi:inhibitor of cysteine peptidase
LFPNILFSSILLYFTEKADQGNSMKKHYRYCKALLLMAICTSSFAKADTLSYNVSANSSHFTISLPSNPTTGYSWKLQKSDATLLTLVKDTYIPSKSNLMGAKGNMQFTFRLLQIHSLPDSTSLSFSYQRPWEKTSIKTQAVTVHFLRKGK